MSTQTEWMFTVEGMTCATCAQTIDRAVRPLAGVLGVSSDHARGVTRVVMGPSADAAAITDAIRSAGYEVTGLEAHAEQERRARREPNDTLDLLVIGGGSAAFAAAVRASELGARVAMVERGALGGTCVNIGCVPSKTLIRAAEAHFRPAHHAFAGVRAHREQVDLAAVVEQKRELVAELRQAKYADVLAARPEIELVRGEARMRRDGVVEIDGVPRDARRVLIATGASPWAPPIAGLAEAGYLTSTELMELESLPRRLAVLGAGAVGLELAQTYARFGSEVIVLEALEHVAPQEDADLSDALAGYLRAEGLDVRTSLRVREVAGTASRYRIALDGGDIIEADALLVATGRRPNTRGLGLEEAGVRLGARGEVIVDEHLRTTREGVYAAGDVIGDPAFVYVAAYAGKLAAEHALGHDAQRYDVSLAPRITFTDPQLAAVGLTEAQSRAQGLDIVISRLPMSQVPRAQAARDTRGLVKLVVDARTRLLVGAHVLAPEAGDVIEEAVLAMRFGIRVDDLAALMHPYLTNAEALKLACIALDKDVATLSCCAG